jgi:hypothetical protein
VDSGTAHLPVTSESAHDIVMVVETFSSTIASSSAATGGDVGVVSPGQVSRGPEFADVGRLWRRGLGALMGIARAEEQLLPADLIAAHLGAVEGADLPVVEETWAGYEHVNVQAGLDALLAEPGVEFELVGLVNVQHRHFGLVDLAASRESHGPRLGGIARVQLPAGPDGAVLPAVRCGLYLLTRDDVRHVLFFRGPDPSSGLLATTLQVIGSEPEASAGLATRIRELALEHNVFRGQVLSFEGEMFGHGETILTFHSRPVMREEDLILPDAITRAVHRQVVGVARHRRRLLASGQHLKRGLLLYGPPGVGKTHTVRYLTAALTGTTVIQLSGRSMHLIGEACSVARALQPSMLVIEDVDLIAEDRGMHPGQHPMLFQLLNEMDGLAEDADVLFTLTTNRADLLEPALASRPGRVDQALELQLPDRAARERLCRLDQGSLFVETSSLDDVLDRTDGVTASFLKELLRRAAVRAAERGDAADSDDVLSVSADDLVGALDELLDTRNAMTRVLLGGERADQPAPAPGAGQGWVAYPGRA